MATDRRVDNSSPAMPATTGRLRDGYDLLLVDLDGVVFVGEQAITGAADALAAARAAGVPTVFVTNNASRPPGAVSAQLNDMGVSAVPTDVMTSAIAAATILADRVPAGAPVLVIGGAGVREALVAVGLRPVASAADAPAAVLQGFAPEVGWAMLAEGAVAVRAGATWLATNGDLTLPSPRGPLPGNGSLVAVVAAATGAIPEVIGKPGPALYAAARRQHQGERPLAVGDRIDTDIAGAVAAGLPSLLVMSGVSGPLEVLEARVGARPDFLGRDLQALEIKHLHAGVGDRTGRCGRFEARIEAGAITVEQSSSSGPETKDGLDGLRALAVLAWSLERDDQPEASRRSFEVALESLDLDL